MLVIDQPGGIKWRDQFWERGDKAINEHRWGRETEEIGGRTASSLLAYIPFLAPIHKKVRIKLFGQSGLWESWLLTQSESFHRLAALAHSGLVRISEYWHEPVGGLGSSMRRPALRYRK